MVDADRTGNEGAEDPAQIKYILITHPGPDHLGGAKYFQEAYGTQIVMTASNWDSVLNAPADSWINSHLPGGESYKFWVGPPARSLTAQDGQTLTLGSTTVTMVETPRVPGSGALSYILPVTDHGQPHMWATYGATGAPPTLEGKKLYQQSVKHLFTYMEALKVDSMISNHPFVDGSVDRMKDLASRKQGEANPFVIGTDGARRYVQILGNCAEVWVARNAAGLDDLGQPLQQKTTP
jgi:metallo-beta-lactamase class B